MGLPFNLKFQYGPDISGNDPGAKLDHADPRPYFIIPRLAVALYPSYQMQYSCIDVVEDPIGISTFADAERLSVLCGGYGYMLQGKMDEQIDKFLSSAKKAGLLAGGKWKGRIPPCADVEVEYQSPPKKNIPRNFVACYKGTKWANEVKYWLDGVQQATSVRPWIYTAEPQWRWLLDDKGNPPYWTQEYYYWVKWYPYTAFIDANSAIPKKAYPKGVTVDRIVLWQYFPYGKPQFDYNDINTVTPVGMAVLNNAPAPAPYVPPVVVPPPAKPEYFGTVLVSGLRVREGPSTSYPIHDYLHMNNRVEMINIQQTGFDTWGQLTDGNWIAIKYGGNPYVRLDT